MQTNANPRRDMTQITRYPYCRGVGFKGAGVKPAICLASQNGPRP